MKRCDCSKGCEGFDYFILVTKYFQVRCFDDYGTKFLYIHLGKKIWRWDWYYKTHITKEGGREMRRNLCRAKRVGYDDWLHGYLIESDVIVGQIVEFNDEYFNTAYWFKVNPETIGFNTGRKIRNGREIYEGDIIEETGRYESYRYKVVWNESNVTFDFVDLATEEVFHAEDIHFNHVEVIGNIHDNPELLPAQNEHDIHLKQ